MTADEGFLKASATENEDLFWALRGGGNFGVAKAMRTGILNFAQGCIPLFGTPATHSTSELERQEALEQLATLSTLARWVDRCEVLQVQSVK